MTVEIFWQLIEKARSTAGTNDNAFASAVDNTAIKEELKQLLTPFADKN